MNDQLTECPHDEERDDCAERVGEEHRWSGAAQAAPCAKKQTDADRPTNCHHLDLAIGQGLGIALVAAIDDRLGLLDRGGLGISASRADPGALRNIIMGPLGYVGHHRPSRTTVWAVRGVSGEPKAPRILFSVGGDAVTARPPPARILDQM